MSEESTAGTVKQVVPFFHVRDIERSVRFYVDALGFLIVNRWVAGGKLRWCWLELGNAALMLQEFWYDGPNRNATDDKLGVGVSLNFVCDDALALYRAFLSRGAAPGTPFVGNGMWVTRVLDPDGYHLFFQSPTTEPEESVYAGAS